MKKTLICLLLLASAFAYAEEKTFMVMSDMHVMVNGLWDQNHPEVFYNDPKMVEHSQELFDLAIQRVKAKAPDFLLVPGDLTYNGELQNHQYVAQRFAELEAAGIQVFVIPGNHDISDPGAKDYSSGTGVKTANLSATGFAGLYADFGYGDAVMRLDEGTDSLAYMAYLPGNIAIIGLNTNQSNIGGHKSAGGFTEGMMNFLQQCTAKAYKDGRRNILVMAHHPVMEHINGQSFIDKNHIANMTDGMIPLSDIQQQLLAAHVHVVFTGHAHLHTAAHITSNEYGTLYDISTGSTSSYPSPLRIGTLDTDKGVISLVGDEITKYQEEGYLRDTVLANSALNTLATTLYERIGEIKAVVNKFPMLKMYLDMDKINSYDAAGIRRVTHQYLDVQMRKALCALSRGDEDVFYYDTEVQDGIDAFNDLLQEVLGVDYSTAVMVAQMAGMNVDFGLNPEMLFRSIYENIVIIGNDEVYTPDASGNSKSEDNEGAWLENVSLRDLNDDYTPECENIETTDGALIDENDLPYMWEGITFTGAGTQTVTLKRANGCDSIVTFTLRVRYRNITLKENESGDYYDAFADVYNGYTVNATLNRQFAQGNWSTLCLPFNVSKGQMMALGMNGRVYEFRYAETAGSELTVYFAVAHSIEAGKGYIVNANAKLATKTSFVFSNVTINTSADKFDITDLEGYNDNSGRGSIYLVGTLRTGQLIGSANNGNFYLGLKDNKLYYPNLTTGTSIRAYRGFFRSSTVMVPIGDGDDDDEPLIPQRVRIMVDGVDNGEWTIDNGELMIDNSQAVKYISNGILYIRRNGKTYNTQGERVD